MSASHFLWSIYNPLSATDGFFPSIPNFVSVHHILCRSVLFQLIYFDLLLLACVAIMNVENDEHHNQYQQFSLAAKKSVARISPPRILFRELLFFFLLLYLPFHFSCFTLFPYFFSAILNLALRDRGLRVISSSSGTITLLFTRRKGVCKLPKSPVWPCLLHCRFS